MQRWIAPIGLALAALVMAGPAQAQPRGAPGAHRHDGLHLRLGIGLGGLNVARTSRSSIRDMDRDSTVSGGSGELEVTLGGTVGSGIVLGGTLLLGSTPDAEIDPDASGEENLRLDGSMNIGLLGFTLDWYPDDRAGFHLGATLGALGAWARLPDSSAAHEYGFDGIGGEGGALMITIGYEWWIGRQWSLGGLFRFLGGQIHGETELHGDTFEEDDTVTGVWLALTLVYH